MRLVRWWLADHVLLMIVYLLMRWLLGLSVLVFRGDRAKNAELLVLRHENAVLRRHAGRVRYKPAARAFFTALTLWVPETYATRRYSWITPPARSRRWTRNRSRSVMPSGSGRSGAAWFRVRCGRWLL